MGEGKSSKKIRVISQETDAVCECIFLMEAIMREIRVYYHDVLRYATAGDWDKVQELRNNGFDVRVKEAPGQGSGLGALRSPRSL